MQRLVISLFQGLRPPVRAVVLVILAMLAFSAMAVFIRLGTQELPTLQVVFFRIFFALLILIPMLGPAGFRELHTEHIWWHVVRACIGYIGVLTGFYAIKLIPLAEAVSLGFTIPLFATIGAVLFLGERIRAHRIAALIIGFIGVLVILRPGFTMLTLGSLAALTNALAIAISVLLVKKLTLWDRPLSVVIWVVLLQTPIAFAFAVPVWEWPTAIGWVWMVMIAVCGVAGHLLWTNAVATAEVSKLQPFEFVKLPVISVAGFALFGEATSVWVWLGGGLIVLSTVYIARREALAERQRLQLDEPGTQHRLPHQLRTPLG